MKTIGLLGGMSWESTVTYYEIINQEIQKQLGGFHSGNIILNSVDFAALEEYQRKNDWDAITALLSDKGRALARAGADFALICTNTMHNVYDEICEEVPIPIVHIADATANAILKSGMTTVGLLGTRHTMEKDFYKNRLAQRGIQVLTPNDTQREIVHHIIFQELCLGEINPSSKQQYLEIIADLSRQGAQGIILGCTEIGLLVQQTDTKVPLFDTTVLHAMKAVALALCN